MARTRISLCVVAVMLLGCGRTHPQPQMFSREGWKGYMGPPPKGLDYGGKVELQGDTRDSLVVEVNVRNPTTDSVVVHISTMCRGDEPAFSVRVYGQPHGLLRRRGRPVWTLDGWRAAKEREARAKRAPGQTINGLEEVSVGQCPSVIHALRFGAGDSRSLGTRSIATRDVLGDSLPAGRYLVSAIINGNSFDYILETRVGEIDLRQPAR